MAMAKRVWQLDSFPSNRSKNHFDRLSNCRGSALQQKNNCSRNFEPFLLYFNNQSNDGQTKTSARFRLSKRSRNHLDKCSNYSFELVYRVKKMSNGICEP